MYTSTTRLTSGTLALSAIEESFPIEDDSDLERFGTLRACEVRSFVLARAVVLDRQQEYSQTGRSPAPEVMGPSHLDVARSEY